MEVIKMLNAVIFLYMSIMALLYGILEHSAFWVSIAIYCKISSSITAYELGWLKPNTLAVPREIQDERNRNENSSTGVQQNARQ